MLIGRGSDLGIHAGYMRQIVAGRVPFRDFFPEYPPLVFVLTAIPAIFDRSLATYFPIFRAVCCAVDCGIWVLVLRLNRRQPWQSLLYVLCTTALGSLIYDRIDIVLGAMLLAALVFMIQGRERLFQLTVGVAIAFKLIPVVWAPVILAAEWKKGGRHLAWSIALLSAPLLLSFGVMFALGGNQVGRVFEYHLHRGIQIESIPASVEMLLMQSGAGDGVVSFEYGSVNLHTRYENGIIQIATVLLGATLLASALMAIKRRMDATSRSLLLCAVLSAALVLSKVLSPQFFLFLLPILMALPVPRRRAEAVAGWLLVFLLFGLTGVIFPWDYDALIALKPAAQAIVMVRNECLLLLSAHLFHRAWRASSGTAQVD